MDETPAQHNRTRLGPGAWVDDADLTFSAVRSAGPGGQNVNKRSTKVELRVAFGSIRLPADARARLRRLAKTYLNSDGELVFTCQTSRSQIRNKEGCLELLREVVRRALVRPKVRKKTKPSRGAVQRRIDAKKQRGALKSRRRRVDPD